MYKTIAEAVDFIEKIKPVAAQAEHCEVVVAPPFTALAAAAQAAKGSKVAVSGQDVHWDKEGAHTGDVSPAMLVDAGCTHVIIGHSERRHDHGETDEQVNRKVRAALAASLTPIVCVGETLAERESGRTGRSIKDSVRGRISRIDRLRLFPYHNCLRTGLGDWHRSNGNARDGSGNPSIASRPGPAKVWRKRSERRAHSLRRQREARQCWRADGPGRY